MNRFFSPSHPLTSPPAAAAPPPFPTFPSSPPLRYQLDPKFKAALAYVGSLGDNISDPVVYDRYDQLLDTFGDAVVVESLEGVAIQQMTSASNTLFDTSYLPFVEGENLDKLEDLATSFFFGRYDHNTASESQKLFDSHVTAHVVSCLGGSVAYNCQTETDQWKASAFTDPTPLELRTVPITMLVSDPVVKRNLEIVYQMNVKQVRLLKLF